jgi:hypothetical protein
MAAASLALSAPVWTVCTSEVAMKIQTKLFEERAQNPKA